MNTKLTELYDTLHLIPENLENAQNKENHLLKLLNALAPELFSCQDDAGDTLFHLMARHGLQSLFSHGLKLHPQGVLIANNLDQYPIHTAILNRQPAMVSFILAESPQQATLPDSKGQIALHYAARYGSTDVVNRCCIASPSLINSLDGEMRTPLMLAVESCNLFGNISSDINVLQILINHGADVTLVNYHGSSILHKAIDTMKMDLIVWVLNHVDENIINHPDDDGRSPLAHLRHNYRVQFDFLEAVEKLLLDKGASHAVILKIN